MDSTFIVTVFTSGITVTAGRFDHAKYARNFAKDCVRRGGNDDAVTVYDTESGNRVYHVEAGTVIVDNTEYYL